MIKIENTENLAGVTISGDYDDLSNLVDAFYAITICDDNKKHSRCIDMSTYLLGLCYEIRHAYMGDREVELVENNMDEEKMKWHSIIAPKKNLNFKCKIFYPEMFYHMLAMNKLIEIRITELTKTRYAADALDRRVIWDDTIAAIRYFQAAFAKCVKETLPPASYNRWLSFMNKSDIHIQAMGHQFMDVLNINYLSMSREKRLKNLNTIARRIAEFWDDEEWQDIDKVLEAGAKKYGCPKSDVRLVGVEYPDEIEW